MRLPAAHDALTHVDHPLHPGKKGVDMYLGMTSISYASNKVTF